MPNDFPCATLGRVATAIGRAELVEITGMRSQLRGLLDSEPRARMALERPFAGAILATRIGLEVLETIPLTRCLSPLAGVARLLVVEAAGLVAIAICATGCAALPAGGAVGPDATVSTTPLEV